MDASTEKTRNWRVTATHIILARSDVDYQVPRARCDTWPKVYGWVVEILGKPWSVRSVVIEFIDTAAKAAQLEVYKP